MARRRWILCALMGVLALGAAPARATTYYVSRSSGDDGWNGQASSRGAGGAGPWKTLARASTDFAPGDRLLLQCGDAWNEELHPKGNGTPAKPIVIASYGQGPKPVIDRQDHAQDRIGLHLADQEGFAIAGIEFARCMTGIYAEYSEGCPTKRFLRIEDCLFRDSLLYQHYEDYPRHKIGLGVCLFSHERTNRVVLSDVAVVNCVFRRLASGFWTNNPDNFNKNAPFIYNFANLTFEGCLFEEGLQWPLGIRGVAGGAVRNCVTHDVGRGFRSFNGVAGAMFFRCKDWVFEDSEWGFIDLGAGSGDGEAFDFEGNCDNMTMRNCLFHDTDGPGFLLCCYASGPQPNTGIRMTDCVLNGKARRPIRLPRCEIVNTTDWNESTWTNCRFYLSKGEVLMRVMDPEKDKKSSFVNCVVKDLSAAGSAGRVAGQVAVSQNQWVLDFGKPATVNEFRLREAPGSSVARYVIECWDAKASKWVGCFNGAGIGADFIAPIVARATTKARVRVIRTAKGAAAIGTFEAYNDTSGEVFSVPRGGWPPGRAGR